jgi:hypothetical protein
MQALDELVARWRKNPDPEATLALCAHLGTSHEAELMREVANLAEAWHRDNHSVMLSVGRMYLDAGLLAEAQATLLQAGKIEPTDSEAYRFLGEVLLRRGDAIRSEKALARAIQLGAEDPDTQLWHERAVIYVALQKRQGLAAVADEVARTAPHQASIPAPTLSPFDRIDRESAAAATRTARRSRPPLAAGRRRSSAPKASRRRGSTPPPPGPDKQPQDTLLMGRSPLPMPNLERQVHPPSPFVHSQSHSPKAAAKRSRTPAGPNARALDRAAATPADGPRPAPLAALLKESMEGLLGELGSPADTHPDSGLGADPFQGTFSDAAISTDVGALVDALQAPEPSGGSHGSAALDALRHRRVAEVAAAAPPVDVTLPGSLASLLEPRSNTSLPASALLSASAPSSAPIPRPETVLVALARVGLYEKDSTVVPAWETAPRPVQRRLRVMAGALLATLGIGLGGYRYALGVQADRAAQAQELGMRLSSALDSGSRVQLSSTEADFQRLFELDSRGADPALLWLQNRTLHTLLDAEPASGIESALQRARSVGVEERRLIFGRLASSVATGDLPGAGAVIAEWDARAKDDAMYQLLAGVVFERAGSAEALERYTAATRLQPDLKLAHMLAARLALLQLGSAESKSLVEIACARLGSAPAADVLRGLAWATAPFGDAPAPALPSPEASADLSPLLQGTAEAVAAVRAQREGRAEESLAAFKRALDGASTPALAAWIGYRALDAGDVETARLAALQAMKLSAMHESSQALAARIALAEGRLDAAREAVRGVDPSSRDAVLIEAASAYENLQGPEAARLIAALPADATTLPTLEALRDSDKLISGQSRPKDERLVQLATEQRTWGAIVAVDMALDSGRIELGARLIGSRGWDGKVPAHAARMMRLERYRGQGAAALVFAPALLEARPPGPRALAELVLTLTSEGRAAAAASALHDRGAAAGPLEPWLEAIVEAAAGRQGNGAKALASLDLPGKARPALEQVVALRALAAVKDRRAKPYYAQLERRLRAHPDVLAAGKQLGLIK